MRGAGSRRLCRRGDPAAERRARLLPIPPGLDQRRDQAGRGAEQRTASGWRGDRARFRGPDAACGRTGRPPGPRVPLLSSFSPEALAAARDAAPWLPRGLLCRRIPANWRDQLQRLQCVALHCDHRTLDAPGAAQVRSAGFWLFCYTVNDRQRAIQLAQWGVDALCTDRLDLIEPTLLDSSDSRRLELRQRSP